MKWIKKFESYSYSKEEIENDIKDILVELIFDKDFDVRISWHGDDFELVFKKETGFGGYKPFNSSEILEDCLKLIDYIKSIWTKSIYKFTKGDKLDKEIELKGEQFLLFSTLYFQKEYSENVVEGFGYSDEDYNNEVMHLLKQSDLRPVQINKLFDFYSDMIEEYKNDGKSPKIVVDEIFNIGK